MQTASKGTESGADKPANTGGLGVALSRGWFWKCPTCKKSGTETTQAAALELMHGDARGRGKHCPLSSSDGSAKR